MALKVLNCERETIVLKHSIRRSERIKKKPLT